MKHFSMALAIPESAWLRCSSELDHNVKTGPHSFRSFNNSARKIYVIQSESYAGEPNQKTQDVDPMLF